MKLLDWFNNPQTNSTTTVSTSKVDVKYNGNWDLALEGDTRYDAIYGTAGFLDSAQNDSIDQSVLKRNYLGPFWELATSASNTSVAYQPTNTSINAYTSTQTIYIDALTRLQHSLLRDIVIPIDMVETSHVSKQVVAPPVVYKPKDLTPMIEDVRTLEI